MVFELFSWQLIEEQSHRGTAPHVKVVVLPQQPWVHGIYQQDGIHNPNQTLCGIERDIRGKFFESKKDFFDFAELIKLRSNSGVRFIVCGVCWWVYCYGN